MIKTYPMNLRTTKNIPVLLLVLSMVLAVSECGIYKMMADAMGWEDDHWHSKGITFGLKSKGMTAIIPFPLPIPIFSKEKKSSGGGDKGGGDKGGGWEPQTGGNDWW